MHRKNETRFTEFGLFLGVRIGPFKKNSVSGPVDPSLVELVMLDRLTGSYEIRKLR